MAKPSKGYQVVFNGTDYQVRGYPGQVVDRRKLAEAKEYCRLLNAVRRSPRSADRLPQEDGQATADLFVRYPHKG